MIHRFSQAARTVQCPGSVRLCAEFQNAEQSESAALGTLAHSVAVGTAKTDDPEMLAAVKIYNDDTRRMVELTGQKLHVEEKIDCPSIHLENRGTPDAWLYAPLEDTLYIWDFKYGHAFVDHVMNWQLLNEAAAILPLLPPATTNNRRVCMTVVQPRNFDSRGPIRRWTQAAVSLKGYFEKMQLQYAAADEKTAKCETGPECEYCPARHTCRALQQMAHRGMEIAQLAAPVELSGDALGRELIVLQKYRDRMDARITGLTEQATHMLKAGERVTGFHLESSFGREKWIDVEMAKMFFGDSIVKPAELITPRQAIAAGCDAEMVASLVERQPGAPKLKSDGNLLGVFNGHHD